MQRVMHRFPRQGAREPWVNSQDYFREREQFRQMDLDEPALRYDCSRHERGAGVA
jgi:monooxygenase